MSLPRVIPEQLLKDLTKDLTTILSNTTNEKARKTIQDRLDRLNICPIFRKGQDYVDGK